MILYLVLLAGTFLALFKRPAIDHEKKTLIIRHLNPLKKDEHFSLDSIKNLSIVRAKGEHIVFELWDGVTFSLSQITIRDWERLKKELHR